MDYKALVNFSGAVSAVAGGVVNIDDPAIAADLLTAGYVKEIGKKPEAKKAAPKKKSTKKGAK